MNVRLAATLTLFALTCAAARAADWPVFDHDAARSGDSGSADSQSKPLDLHVRWKIKLDDVADSAPIVAGDRLFLTVRDGTTYAIDTTNGKTLWNFATHGPKITTSVPAYDESAKVLYAGGVDGMVHKLDPQTGRELRDHGFPAKLTLATDTEKDASPLNVSNGYVYAQMSGYIGDAPPYVGHIVAISTADGSEHVFNSLCANRGNRLLDPQSCDAQRSGMWSRAGVVVDPDPSMHGRIYGATGNAPYDPGKGDYGDTIVALNANATRLEGHLTPSDYDSLEANDLDVGSSSPALLPRQNGSATPLLAVQGGKDGTLRLFDREHIDRSNAVLQTMPLGDELFSAPAVRTGPGGTTFVYVGLADGIHAFKLTMQDRKSRLETAWTAPLSAGREGASPVVNAGVMYVAIPNRLVALDAATGKQLGSSDSLGPIHWESPAVANDTVYCTDESGALTAFAVR